MSYQTMNNDEDRTTQRSQEDDVQLPFPIFASCVHILDTYASLLNSFPDIADTSTATSRLLHVTEETYASLQQECDIVASIFDAEIRTNVSCALKNCSLCDISYLRDKLDNFVISRLYGV